MRWLLLALSLLGFVLPTHQAQAQSSGVVVQVCGTLPLAYRPGAQGVISLDVNGNTCIAGTFSATGGTISNGTDGQATTSTNQGAVAYNYGFNGATWDRLQVDASKFLKVNCAAGCTAGTASNATSAQATSATNGQTVSWLYGFNGATWDQLQVDASKSLKINCVTGCGGAGTVSNATSGVATSSTNTGAVSWLYGFNGTTWDQLQVDANKFLKITLPASSVAVGAALDGWDVTQGAKADAVCATDSGTCSELALIKRTNQNLTTLNASVQAPIAGVTQAQTSAAASNLVAKASPGSVVSISGSAVSGSFIMLFDATSAPADGAVTPKKCWGPMAAAGPFVFGWGPGPVFTAATGITVVSSSTGCFTKTATNAAFIAVEYQ